MKIIEKWLFGKYVKITETFRPKPGRTEKQIYYDAVLKLQDEIVKSGAIKIDHLENGSVKVTLNVKN